LKQYNLNYNKIKYDLENLEIKLK